MKGISKFFNSMLPEFLFYHLVEIRQGVFKDAPVLQDSQQKYPLVLFSHGVGQTCTFFSTIFKDLATQGFVVASIEHKDHTSLHFLNPAGKSKYYKNIYITNSD